MTACRTSHKIVFLGIFLNLTRSLSFSDSIGGYPLGDILSPTPGLQKKVGGAWTWQSTALYDLNGKVRVGLVMFHDNLWVKGDIWSPLHRSVSRGSATGPGKH